MSMSRTSPQDIPHQAKKRKEKRKQVAQTKRKTGFNLRYSQCFYCHKGYPKKKKKTNKKENRLLPALLTMFLLS